MRLSAGPLGRFFVLVVCRPYLFWYVALFFMQTVGSVAHAHESADQSCMLQAAHEG